MTTRPRKDEGWKHVASAGALGFTLVGCSFLGLALGRYLDQWLDTSPGLTLLLFLVGTAAGFMNMFRRRPGGKDGGA